MQEAFVAHRTVPASHLRPGGRIWVGADARLVVDVAAEGDEVALTVQVPVLGAVVARLPADTPFELCRDREEEKG
jgi:hypothetical protein